MPNFTIVGAGTRVWDHIIICKFYELPEYNCAVAAYHKRDSYEIFRVYNGSFRPAFKILIPSDSLNRCRSYGVLLCGAFPQKFSGAVLKLNVDVSTYAAGVFQGRGYDVFIFISADHVSALIGFSPTCKATS